MMRQPSIRTLLDFAKAGCAEQAEKNANSDASTDVILTLMMMMIPVVCPRLQLRQQVYQLMLLRVKNSHRCNPFLAATLDQCSVRERMPEIKAWYSIFPFIEYSASTNAVFCFSCWLFPHPTTSSEQVFTSVEFRGWKSIRTSLQKHQNSASHKASMTRWAGFRQTKRTGTVAGQLDSHRRATIAQNRKYLTTMLKIALLCATQDIARTGHDESDRSDNKGNFREILSLLASENPSLQQKIDTAPSNAKYYSKEIQNDLLGAAASIVLHGICQDIQSAHFFR